MEQKYVEFCYRVVELDIMDGAEIKDLVAIVLDSFKRDVRVNNLKFPYYTHEEEGILDEPIDSNDLTYGYFERPDDEIDYRDKKINSYNFRFLLECSDDFGQLSEIYRNLEMVLKETMEKLDERRLGFTLKNIRFLDEMEYSAESEKDDLHQS